MDTRKYMMALVAAVISMFALVSLSLAQQCPAGSQPVSVKGKIFNNLLFTGQTLGIVQLVFANHANAKCGIMGNPIPPDPNNPSPLNFEHTLVCDDHSELWLITRGNITGISACPNGGSSFSSFSFVEVSTPNISLPHKGLFEDITGGQLTIRGTVNCELEIDMKFDGYACFP
jgi:hypothetical protein